jgi:hypothetical protein
MIAWPKRLPDLTPLDFSVWGCMNDQDIVPPLPASLEKLQAWITAVVETTDVDDS